VETRTRSTTRRERRDRARDTAARVRSDPAGQTRWVNSDSYVARDGPSMAVTAVSTNGSVADAEQLTLETLTQGQRVDGAERETAADGASRSWKHELEARGAPGRRTGSQFPTTGALRPIPRVKIEINRERQAVELLLKPHVAVQKFPMSLDSIQDSLYLYPVRLWPLTIRSRV
jgi:hypothetical protein